MDTFRTPILSQSAGPLPKETENRTAPSPQDQTRDLIIQSLLYYPKQYAEFIQTQFGVVYLDTNNPFNTGSNHTLVFDHTGDLNQTVDEIVSFYHSNRIEPAIYQAFREGEEENLFPLLREKGFDIEIYPHTPMILHNRRDIPFAHPENSLYIRRIKELDPTLINGLLDIDNADWKIKMFQRQLPDDRFFLFTGENQHGKIVTTACLYTGKKISRIDDVITHPHYRNNGYATGLMNYILKVHETVSDNPLFLLAENDTSLGIYKKLGFQPIDFPFPFWGAYLDESTPRETTVEKDHVMDTDADEPGKRRKKTRFKKVRRSRYTAQKKLTAVQEVTPVLNR